MKIIGYPSRMLAKFCPEEFNIRKNGNTVRFGTLYDYRTHEDEKLRDAGEGTFDYRLEFPELTKVSQEWLAAFDVEAGASLQADEIHLNDGDIFIKNISLSGSSHNCWIYCLSKNTDSAGNVSDTHQDKWLLPLDKLEGFASYLAAILWDDVSFEDLPGQIVGRFSLQDIQRRLSIGIEIGDVNYSSRSVVISSEEQLPIPDISRLRDSVAFIKPKLFAQEEEVRIAFWLLLDNKKISIVNKPKIVSLRAIDKII